MDKSTAKILKRPDGRAGRGLAVRRLLLLALLLTCGTAEAAKWVSFDKDANGAKTDVDVSSIRIAGQIRRALVKVFYAPQTQSGVGANAQKWVHYTLSHDAFDCGNGKHRDEALITYFSDGTTDRVGPNSLPTPWELVAPDSVGGEVMKFVCTRQRE